MVENDPISLSIFLPVLTHLSYISDELVPSIHEIPLAVLRPFSLVRVHLLKILITIIVARRGEEEQRHE